MWTGRSQVDLTTMNSNLFSDSSFSQIRRKSVMIYNTRLRLCIFVIIIICGLRRRCRVVFLTRLASALQSVTEHGTDLAVYVSYPGNKPLSQQTVNKYALY